jgi:hypothetical protein
MAVPKVRTKEKDPDAKLDYKLDWSDWLAETPSGADTISTSTWTVTSGLTKESDANDDDSTTIWLSGGTAGSDYEIINSIVTDGGRQDDVALTIYVRNR